jgi:hypothetical protein
MKRKKISLLELLPGRKGPLKPLRDSDRALPKWVKNWKWHCESCGTLTNDGECDCTKFPETVGKQRLVRTVGINWTALSEQEGAK